MRRYRRGWTGSYASPLSVWVQEGVDEAGSLYSLLGEKWEEYGVSAHSPAAAWLAVRPRVSTLWVLLRFGSEP